MKKIFLFLIFIFLFTSCKSQKNSIAYSSETLKIIPVSENSYIHISYLETDDFGKVACNGLIFINNNEAAVFDTPTNSEVSMELIKWIAEDKKCDITSITINHFHDDCLGGLDAFHKLGIPSFANNKTIILAKENASSIPQIGFDDKMEITVGEKKVINHFIGEAHTKDNIISYVPTDNLIFGGCMVKSLNASKGYTGDANTAEWSNTIKKIKKYYPSVNLVVPGHGAAGNEKLLDYTIQLFKEPTF